jgi:hypothetical protein
MGKRSKRVVEPRIMQKCGCGIGYALRVYLTFKEFQVVDILRA